MAKTRIVWVTADQQTRALMLERKALQAVVARLIEAHFPYEQVRRICYDATRDLLPPQSERSHKPSLDYLANEALEHMHTLIDEMVEQNDRG